MPQFILEPYRFAPEKLIPLNKSFTVWSGSAVGTRKGDTTASSSPKNILRGFHRNSIGSCPDWNARGKPMTQAYVHTCCLQTPARMFRGVLWPQESCYDSHLGQGMLAAIPKTRTGGTPVPRSAFSLPWSVLKKFPASGDCQPGFQSPT